MADAFDRAWSLVKAPWYYHATPMENLGPIAAQGIKSNFGEVYASRDEDGAAKWIGMTRPQSRQIITLPFWRDEGDPRMRPGIDHSPILARILGIDPEMASFVSNEPIPPEDIDWPNAMQYENPWFSEELQEQMRRKTGDDDEPV